MYFIGLDGGGTKSVGVVTDETGSYVKAEKFGPGNAAVMGVQNVRPFIEDLLKNILPKDCENPVIAAGVGFAGAGRDVVKWQLVSEIRKTGIEHVTVFSDAELLYQAAFGETPGILLIAGTGSVALTKYAGKFLQIGGWGYLLGDEGSGFSIGRLSIRHVLKQEEERSGWSPLANTVLSFYKAASGQELISKIYATENAQNYVASMAKTVCGLADQGEKNAVNIIDAAVNALILMVLKCAAFFPENQTMPMSLYGGILTAPVISEKFKHQAVQKKLNLDYVTPKYHPAVAGALFSMRQMNVEIDDMLIEELQTKIRNL